MTEVETALVELEMAVDGWKKQQWDETMRFCEKCSAWINCHFRADVVRVCPMENECEAPGE